jgi:hypothetical protein
MNTGDGGRDTGPAAGGAGGHVTHIGSVEFAGAFEPAEREYLAGQFSRCRFELLARSVQDPKIVVVAWLATLGRSAGGPSPLYAAPVRATYVLDGNALSEEPAPAQAAGSGAWTAGGRRGAAAALVRINDTRELEARFAGHFPGVQVSVPWWDRVRCAFRRAMPGVIAGVLALWLALVLWVWRGQ